MAQAIIGPLVGKLTELALNEAKALGSVSKDIRSLCDKLMWLQAFLQEADPRVRIRVNELIRVLVQQIRDVAFDAEDAIDEYFLRVDLPRYPSWSHATVGFFAGFTTQMRVRHSLSGKIQDIKLRLEEIINNKEKYKLEGAAASPVVTWRASAAFSNRIDWDSVKRPVIIGRTNELKQLEEELLKGKARRTVVCVCGDSGIGRKTLVSDVYQKRAIREHFKDRAWVSLSPHFDANKTIKLINKKFETKDKDLWEVDGDKGKRYLLVIDGQLTKSDLNVLLDAMPQNENGSRVVLIMKSTGDRLINDDDFKIVKLNYLEHDASIELFRRRACSKEYIEKEGDAEDSDENVVKKEGDDPFKDCYKDVPYITGGLPLAVVLLSGLVRTKEFPDERKQVFKHLKSLQGTGLKRILPLSFDDLPHDLKSCFLYFAAFPKNSRIDLHQMVRLWTAEGFIRPMDGRTMETVGHCHMKELIDRGLVNLKFGYGDPFITIHDYVHEFVRFEAKEAGFVETHSGDGIPSLATVRRLSLQNSMYRYAALANGLPKLRSVFSHFPEEQQSRPLENDADAAAPPAPSSKCFVKCISRFNCSCKGGQSTTRSIFNMERFLRGSKFLRVIHIQDFRVITELPEAIGNMVHLRYLGVRCSALTELPTSIGKLTNLQTLDVRGSPVKDLPKALWKIQALRHVLGDDLILPKRVGNLKHLQTLEKIKPGKDTNWHSSTLAKMIHLQSLDATNLSENNARALSGALSNLNYLTSLVLVGEKLPFSWSLQRLVVMKLSGELDLPSLDQPDTGSFYLPNLTQLELSKTKATQGFIDKIAKLPALRRLVLGQESYADKELVFHRGGFPRLTQLNFFKCTVLENVVVEKRAMPQLAGLWFRAYSENLKVELHDMPKIVDKIKSGDAKLNITNIPSSE